MRTPGGVRKRGARRGGERQMGLLDALSGFLLGPVRALARRAALADEPVCAGLRLRGGGGDGDMPDWTERGKVSNHSKKRGPDARAPDWASDPAKFAAKMEKDKRDRGELVVALGPYCVPCGKRFAKQSVYDAHLAGQKHLRALQRLGRTEEAMVCQLDVEAKRRKMVEFEAARDAAGVAATHIETASAEEVEKRRQDREAKLRERAMRRAPDPSIPDPPSLHP